MCMKKTAYIVRHTGIENGQKIAVTSVIIAKDEIKALSVASNLNLVRPRIMSQIYVYE